MYDVYSFEIAVVLVVLMVLIRSYDYITCIYVFVQYIKIGIFQR